MTQSNDKQNPTRRQFLKQGSAIAAGTTAFGSIARMAHAAEDNTIRLALIGCGSRGAGAIRDALSVPDAGPIKLYAAADLLEGPMNAKIKSLKEQFPGQSRRGRRPQVSRLRRLSQGRRHPPTGRHRPLHDPGLHPLRPHGVRRQEGHQRLHGKTLLHRPRRIEADAQGRRRSGKDRLEDRRRPPVPTLPGSTGPDRTRSATAPWAISP